MTTATSTRNGILLTSQITWNTWEPGGEYTKVIKIKNVDTKTHKIKYKTPKNKCFSTKYPQTITLCSGNTAKIPITFKPLEKELYSDQVEFCTRTDKFTVNVQAVLPRYSIDLPHSLGFETCGIQTTAIKTFTLVNKSIETYFKWSVAAPFSIEPALGLLPERGHCDVTVKFTPSEAHVYDSKAVVSFGNDQHKDFFISGVGKHPYIMVGDGKIEEESVHQLLNFGDVPIGTSTSKVFHVKNMSSVNANVSISHQISGTVAMDKVFVCKRRQHMIKPYSSISVKIDFLPTIEKMAYTDYFYISPAGFPSQCVVKCVGRSTAPDIKLSTSILSFKYAELNTEHKQYLTISNQSNVKTSYQIVLDSTESVFKVDKNCGTLDGKEERTIVVKFVPLQAIPYYKRIPILLHRQEPIFLDLLGSGYTNEIRPARLIEHDLENFVEKVRTGLSMYPPEVQAGILADDKTILSPGVPFQDQPPSSQYFTDVQMMTESTTMHVTADIETIDFAKCRAFQKVHHKTVTVTNHTKGRVTAIWNDNPDSVFTVLPTECDIQPYKSASFRVNFHPQKPNQFYGADLECTTFYKSMRDAQLVNDDTMCASWSQSVYCTGETFEPGHEPFLPRYETDTSAILFPPALPDQPVYRTLLLRNQGDTPMSFVFEDDPMGIFSVKPMTGVIYNEVCIVMVRFLANQSRSYQHNLACTLNTKHKIVFPCVAAVELPTAWLENEGAMVFKPSCVGSVTEHCYGVRNTSRLPLHFEWKLHNQDNNLTVSPLAGVILPNDTQYQSWKFSPKDESVLKAMNVLSIFHVKNNRRKLTVSSMGQATKASLECLPKKVNFGISVVGEVSSETVSLHNPYSCTADYELSLEYDGPDHCDISLDKTSGSLSAYGKEELYVTYQPLSQANYNVKVICTINSQRHTLLTLTGEGVFPKLSFIDIRSVVPGILCNASKKRIWDLFSLDLLNKHLAEAPDPTELRQLMETRSNDRTKPFSTKALAVVDFGSNTVGSDPSKVVVVMKNSGKVSSSFRFLFPPDLCLDMATWAEDKVEDATRAQERFNIEPREGTIKPGDTLSLMFTYRHGSEGIEELPILLKLSRGREIMLQLRGVTVKSGLAYPQIAHKSHTLQPVIIGSNCPPIQYYELYNGGDSQMGYEVMDESLAQLTHENYGCEIMKCLQPTGRVQPHSIAQIPFLFSPLEAKTYAVKVPIMIVGGDTYTITIFGEGITPGQHSTVQKGSVIPDKQAVLLDNQLAVLSNEAIDFGVVPTFSVSKKIVFITNTSKEHITFRWNTNTTPLCGEVISVSPNSGTLAPSASTTIEVSLLPSSYPAIFDLDIICELTDNSKESAYVETLAQYANTLEEDRITFTIKEAKPQTPDKIDKSRDNWAATETLNKYHALPPIRALAPSPLDRPETREYCCTKNTKHCSTKKRESPKKEQPSPPVPEQPFYLHLRIIGQVADIKLFSGDLGGFDVPTAGIIEPDTETELEIPRVASTTEVSTISNVLSFVLKSLLDDVDVHTAIRNLSKEPIPFFAQITRPQATELDVIEEERSVEETTEELAEAEQSAEGRLAEPSPVPASSSFDVKLSPLITEILGETVANIIQETVQKELVLTARSRTIALPPRSPHHIQM
ncbi:cilia- and flagella-associated protein 65-like isoform X2 [Bolinopsis microptera]|uniref:cilia- and flagella-associated protein 65-like isoform X2 n=1 Tax=Bolinopsis microptera TaxID=2820187 RepID=UPI0030798D90